MGSEFAINGSGGNSLARRAFAVERRDAPDGRTVLACIGELTGTLDRFDFIDRPDTVRA